MPHVKLSVYEHLYLTFTLVFFFLFSLSFLSLYLHPHLVVVALLKHARGQWIEGVMTCEVPTTPLCLTPAYSGLGCEDSSPSSRAPWTWSQTGCWGARWSVQGGSHQGQLHCGHSLTRQHGCTTRPGINHKLCYWEITNPMGQTSAAEGRHSYRPIRIK